MRWKLYSGKIVSSHDMKRLDDILGLEFKPDHVYLNSQFFAERIND